MGVSISEHRKILVLDDEPGILDAYRIILEPIQNPGATRMISSRRASGSAAAVVQAPEAQAEAFEVLYVTTGEQALKEIETALKNQAPFACGFFDVKLGSGIDGIETIRRAKELDPNLFCCIVSAYQDRGIEEITKIFGEEYADHWDFLTKPFNAMEIQQKARNLTSNWERARREENYLVRLQTQQELLLRSERLAAMGTLARGIGHEFGNIVMRILGRAEIARAKNDPKEMNEALGTIASAAERAGVIVRNLQSLVKIETKREEGDPLEPLKEGVQFVGYELKKAKVEIKENYGTVNCLALINKVELSQVFLNLMINAMHSMEIKGGTLTLTAEMKDGGVSIRVADTGCGIAPEHSVKIFEPLFTTKGDRGSGIGLSVSKKIIENHNGKISVESTIGKGTTFTIWIPAKG